MKHEGVRKGKEREKTIPVCEVTLGGRPAAQVEHDVQPGPLQAMRQQQVGLCLQAPLCQWRCDPENTETTKRRVSPSRVGTPSRGGGG